MNVVTQDKQNTPQLISKPSLSIKFDPILFCLSVSVTETTDEIVLDLCIQFIVKHHNRALITCWDSQTGGHSVVHKGLTSKQSLHISKLSVLTLYSPKGQGSSIIFSFHTSLTYSLYL